MTREALPNPFEPEAEVDATTARILDAAYERMLGFGLRRTTIEDIARAAGIGRPTLYRRFVDKDAIVRAVIVRETRRSLRSVTKRIARMEDPDEQIVRGFVLVTKTAARHPLMRRLVETEPDVILPYVSVHAGFVIDLAQRTFGPILKLMRGKQHEGVDVRYAIEAMVRMFLSITMTPSALVNADDEAAVETFARTIVLPMLAPRARG